MENNFHMEEGVEILHQGNADVIYQQDKATVDIQISTAKQFPRDVKRAVNNSIAIATMDKETAQSCNYSLPRAGKNISGPSVDLARILVQNWGNIRVEAKVVDISAKHVTSQAVAFDLENNVAVKVEVKRSILTRKGRMKEDMITVTGNAANSIAFRNAVFNIIPKSVTNKIYGAALNLITGELSTEQKLIKKRKEVLDSYRDNLGVSEEEILAVLGKNTVNTIVREDIVLLIGLANSIKNGDTTVEETFRAKNKNTQKSKTVKEISEEKEYNRISEHIRTSSELNELYMIEEYLKDDNHKSLFAEKEAELKAIQNKSN